MAEKPSVCHCLISGGIGGIERLVSSLVKEQIKSRKVSVLFCMSGGPFAEEIESIGVETHCLGLRSGFDLRSGKIVKSIEIFRRHDIIHLHANNPVLFAALLFSMKRGVFTFHGLTRLRRELRMQDRVKNWLTYQMLRRSGVQVTTVSNFMDNMIRAEYPRIRKVHIIYNCVENLCREPAARTEMRRNAGTKNSDFLILTYSRLVHNKRIDMLLKAYAAIGKEKRQSSSLVVAGDGPDRGRLKALTIELGISDRVHFTGFIRNIYDYIHMADVCIFPTESEPFGICALEALLMGRIPIVMMDGGGILEVVKPVQDKICMPGGLDSLIMEDVQALTRAIETLMKNKERLKAYEPVLRAMASEYSPQKIVGQYDCLYNSTIREYSNKLN